MQTRDVDRYTALICKVYINGVRCLNHSEPSQITVSNSIKNNLASKGVGRCQMAFAVCMMQM